MKFVTHEKNQADLEDILSELMSGIQIVLMSGDICDDGVMEMLVQELSDAAKRIQEFRSVSVAKKTAAIKKIK